MSILSVETPFNIDLDFSIAQFHHRFFAWLIDSIILILYQIISTWLLFRLFGSRGFEYGFYHLFIYLPYLVYHLLFELFNKGQSIGKYLMGIRVISMDGKNESGIQCAVRWLMRSMDFGIFIGIILISFREYFMGLFFVVTSVISLINLLSSKYNQRLGDFAAGTVVVYKKLPYHFSDTIFRDVENHSYKVHFPQVMKLSDNDLNVIDNALKTHTKSHIPKYLEKIAVKIKSALDIDTELEDDIFLEILLKDYNYLSKS